jgi:hypothetical protein
VYAEVVKALNEPLLPVKKPNGDAELNMSSTCEF